MRRNDTLAFLFILLIFPFILYWGLKSGTNLKMLTLSILILSFVILAFIDIRYSILLVFLWLPFKGLIRRLFYLIAPFQKYDIIHLTEPAYLTFLLLLLLLKERKRLAREFATSKIFRVYLLLILIFILQIFNPLQGNILVGLAGAIFTLFPALWFIVGYLYGDEELLKKVLTLIALTSFVCAIYGLFQFFHGLLPFEKYWVVKVQRYYSTIIFWGYPRAFSTFMSPGESARYFATGATILTGLLLYRLNLTSVGLLSPVLLGLILTGVRSSLFGFLFSLITIYALKTKNIRRAFLRGAVLFITVFILVKLLPPPRSTSQFRYLSPAQLYYSHVARGLKNPVGEKSLKTRFKTWKKFLTQYTLKYPVGQGLGTGTLAGWKFEGTYVGTESYIFSLLTGTGIPGVLLFIYLVYLSFQKAFLKITYNNEDKIYYKISLGLLSGLMLNNLFGFAFALYTTGCVGWFLLGAISKNSSQPLSTERT